jgi:hypothetical protein
MTGLQHPLVREYLTRVESAAVGLSPGIRAELLGDLSAHLDSSLRPGPTDEEVEAALTGLGDPEEVVAAAYEGLEVQPPAAPSASGPLPTQALSTASAWGPVEIIAVVGLTLGAFLVPLFGPILGLVMSWVSRRWTWRDKTVATLLCLAPAFLLVALVAIAAQVYLDHLLVLGLLGIVGPMIAGIYLVVRLTSRRDR